MQTKGFFPCPYCGTSLETDKSLGTRMALASLLLAGAVSYFAGASGLMVPFSMVLLTVLFFIGIVSVHSLFWLKLVVARPHLTRDGGPTDLLHFRITGPRDLPKSE
jgi:Na+-translocating ferredoxin:NAD+ oxidoreductase RnfA subunit